MAQITFCWELGGGLGHVRPYVDLIERLRARGDDVAFHVKDLQRAHVLFPSDSPRLLELSSGYTPSDEQIRPSDSYPEVLLNCGYNNAEQVYERVQCVYHAIEQDDADLVITDYAPIAMLANKGLRLPLINSGAGFSVPPRRTPMPRFRYWQGRAPKRLGDNEARLLEILNTVLIRCGWPLLERFADLLDAECEWLVGLPEIDFYQTSERPPYLRFANREFDKDPIVWPPGDGPRVFAYLGNEPSAILVLRSLREHQARVCVYAPTLSAESVREFRTDSVFFSTTPLPIDQMSSESDLFVHNGNLSTVAAALLAGKPQLAVTTSFERYTTARRVELMGAGLAIPLRDLALLQSKIRALLNDRSFARAARAFAKNYGEKDPRFDAEPRMLADIDAILDARVANREARRR